MKIISRCLSWSVISILTLQLCACGYILYPERRGQKSTKHLDWPIVGLDAIGLIFFIIPGVISFAIDFTSGTIYLPKGRVAQLDLKDSRQVQLPKEQLNEKEITKLIQKESGVKISLNDEKLIKYKTAN